MIYLDNAATSYPKPAEVIEAVKNSMIFYGANPGRSGYDFSVKTAEEVFLTRVKLNDFFNGYGSEYVSFFSNCTYALNTAIKGIVKRGDHIVISSLEHNSVLRPVYALKKAGVADYSVFRADENEEVLLNNFRKVFRKKTRLCVVTSVSNVFGNILPLKKMSEIAHKNGALFFVDGAQGAGVIKLDMKAMGIDCLCVPGHKGLLGPMGTGALLHKNLQFNPIVQGGTGTSSFVYSQPCEYPERLESGTLNVPGICGLRKGVEILESIGIDEVFQRESDLCELLFNGLKEVENVKLYRGYYDRKKFAPIVTFNVKDYHSERVSSILNDNGFAVRGGFHCSPLAHKFYGTEKVGGVRVSPSFLTEEKDIKNLLILVRKIAI